MEKFVYNWSVDKYHKHCRNCPRLPKFKLGKFVVDRSIEGLMNLSMYELLRRALAADPDDPDSHGHVRELYAAMKAKSGQEFAEDAVRWATWFLDTELGTSQERDLIPTLYRIRKAEGAALDELDSSRGGESKD